MPHDGSVAPKERVNITYRPATGGMPEDVELPFKMLMVGDFRGAVDERRLEERHPIHVDKENFARVLEEQSLSLDLMVRDCLSGDEGEEKTMCLQFRSLADFGPEGIAEQVPELRSLLELRKALVALKGPLGNLPAFRRKIQALLADENRRGELAAELSLPFDGDGPLPGDGEVEDR